MWGETGGQWYHHSSAHRDSLTFVQGKPTTNVVATAGTAADNWLNRRTSKNQLRPRYQQQVQLEGHQKKLPNKRTWNPSPNMHTSPPAHPPSCDPATLPHSPPMP